MSSPSVLHVDLDAFFVAMEVLRRPELAGTPVVVGFDGPRGVVSTASYEARAFGVHSALPMAQAKRRCPQATYLPVDFEFYAPASQRFHAILRDFSPACESAGTDEAYLDVAGSARLFGDGETIAGMIRERVRSEIGITASVGVATNKLIAKVASDAAKPDGICVVPGGEEASFLAPRPVRELPMVGAKLEERLAQLGLRTIGEVAAYPAEALRARFGGMGEELHARSQGRFGAPVLMERGTAKSVSRETTFGRDEGERSRLRAILRTQAERVARDLSRNGLAARTVVLKLRFPPFETLTRSWTGASAGGAGGRDLRGRDGPLRAGLAGGGGAARAPHRAGGDEPRSTGAPAQAGRDVRGRPAGGDGEHVARPIRGGLRAAGDRDRARSRRLQEVAGGGRLPYACWRGLGGFVTEAPQAQEWLSLGRASKLLGVSHSTVRRWADAGEVRSYRTSGGHRRILAEDVRQFMTQNSQAAGTSDTDRISELAVGRVKRRLSRRRQSHEMDVFAGLEKATRERLRFIGRQLVDLFARFVSSRTRPERFIDDARSIGGEYGRTLVAAGVTLTDAVTTFNALRRSLEETAAQLASEAQLGADEAVEAMESILGLADTVLEGMAQVYEESLARS